MSKTIRVIYTIFLGILIALFVGVGISAFYEGPTMPDYPSELSYPKQTKDSAELDARNLELQKKYDAEIKIYQSESKTYNRNVSIIAISASIITLIISLILVKKILILSDGLLIGGVITLIYSIIRGFDTEGSMFRFIVVTIGLVAVLAIGYVKFILPIEKTAKNKIIH